MLAIFRNTTIHENYLLSINKRGLRQSIRTGRGFIRIKNNYTYCFRKHVGIQTVSARIGDLSSSLSHKNFLSLPSYTKENHQLPQTRVRCSFIHSNNSDGSSISNSDGSSSNNSSTISENLSQIILKHHHDEETNATITNLVLNRPKAANSMGMVMLKELQQCLFELMESPSPFKKSRCLIISSSHPKVFSAGADLKERSKMSIEEAEDFVTSLRNTMQQVSILPIPVIAVVDGMALGGGLELALAADIRISSMSSQNAIFGLPETTLAIIPGAGGTQRLSRMIGISRAKELVFTGKRIDAQTAYEYGILQHLVPDDDNDNENSSISHTTTKALSSPAYKKALKMAWGIANKSGPIAIEAAKQAMNDGYFNASTFEEALEIERQHYKRTLTTRDRLEGLAAFRENRNPVYKGE